MLKHAFASLALLATLLMPSRAADPRFVPHRIKLERAKDAPRSPVGVAAVWGCGFDAAKCNVSVYSGATQVGSRVLWAATGEGIRVLFDASNGASVYYLFVGDMPLPAGPKWEPQAGVIFESRRFTRGSFDSWEDAVSLLQTAQPVLGRSLAGSIFHGINPHDATANFVGRFTGFFLAPQLGTYEFTSMSTGPCFLRVDGRTMTHRPKGGGLNNTHPQGAGKIDLLPGVHQIDFSCIHFGEGTWYAAAAWKPPGSKWHHIIAPTNFVPVARFAATDFAPAEPVPGRLYFESRNVDHSMVDNLAIVNMEFAVLGTNAQRTFQWTFDDGTTATGPRVRHPFPRPGMRKVTLTALENGAKAASLTETVAVRPQWAQQAAWHDPIWAEQFRDLAARDYTAAPVADLTALVRFANAITDRPLLSRLGGFCLKRQSEFGPPDAEIFFHLAQNFEDSAVREYPAAEQAWKAAAAKAAAPLRERARLRLAAYYIDIAARAGEGRKALDAVENNSLGDSDRRFKGILTGDLLLLEGRRDDAAKAFGLLTTALPPKSITPRMNLDRPRIENARDLIRRKEFDKADEIVRQIQWEKPLERMSPEVGIIQVQAFMGRHEFPVALARALQLLNAATVDAQRAEVLYHLIEIHIALKQADLAQEAFAKLTTLYPYSEAAANAKFKWGKGVVKN